MVTKSFVKQLNLIAINASYYNQIYYQLFMQENKKIVVGLFKSLVFILLTVVITNCSKHHEAPSTGKVQGMVTDFASSSAISDVSVVVFDASTNGPVNTTKTDASGNYSFDLSAGTYFLKFNKQGYDPVPPRGFEAVPFSVTVGQTETQDAQMTASKVTNAGYISGKVSVGSTGLEGALVIAEGNGDAYSAVSDKDGNYTIYNVPAATYNVMGFIAQYSSTSSSASVTSGNETASINLTLTKNASGAVAGTFKVISQTTIATPPTTMDIALVHPITKETIPGLSQNVTYASSLSYSFTNVPDGTYVVRASYANDYIVIDPDYITKFGDYTVTIASGTPTPASVDIVATSAVILTSPTNDMSTVVPVDATATPTFQWQAYASTSDYVIEVTDAVTGQVIWGGFSNFGTSNVTKNITIPSSTTSIAFNSDGNASASLTSGRIYRWRIYASKNNQTSATGWNLIAASEDLMGLIKIQ